MEWARDRARLWNQVEACEVRKDAQLAREMDIALPAELTHEQRRELIQSFVKEQFVEQGMVADVAIHKSTKPGDLRNHHAHVMLTMREIDQDGFGKKAREWNDWGKLEGWREQWEKAVNRDLERAGHESRIDHRTLEAQREEALKRGQDERALELARAPQHHKGVTATNLERRGLESEKLERIRKARPAELAPYLEARKEAAKILGELRGLEAQHAGDQEYKKFTEARRQAEERRRQEEARKASEERTLEAARTDRRLFNTLVENFNERFDMVARSHYEEAKKAIIERQKPMVERQKDLAAAYKNEGVARQLVEAEKNTPFNKIKDAVLGVINPSHVEDYDRDLAGINEKRQEYAKEHRELSQRQEKELGDENIKHEATAITWQKHPELLQRAQALVRIGGEWEKREGLERQKQWEQKQKEQNRDLERGGLPRGLGRGDPSDGIERVAGGGAGKSPIACAWRAYSAFSGGGVVTTQNGVRC